MTKPLMFFMVILCLPMAYKAYSMLRTTRSFERAPINHLALIMDGNRRWAKKHHLATIQGHKEGAKTLKRLLHYCLEKNIKMVSVYAFSIENFQRNPDELKKIFQIMADEAETMIPELKKNGVHVRFIGDRSLFPPSVISSFERVEKETASARTLFLNVLFCYGGRQEILSAVQNIVKDAKSGKINDIPDEETFKRYLWTNDLPDPDLIIRTGGAKRLSNCLPYQSSYSELFFTDRYWPDLTAKDLDEALREFSERQRNFGK
jgi:undecaprenyl diphosphate synthase